MKHLLPLLAAGALACATTPEAPATPPSGWSVEARLVEACCCDPICPCIVGSEPTLGMCVGNRLVEIVDGHHGGVELDGVRLVVVFDIPNWTRYEFDQAASPEQVAAATARLGELRGFRFGDLLSVDRVPLKVVRTDATVAFSTPSSTTEIEVLRGFEDEPVRIANLNSFRDYVQYRSITVAHEDAGGGRSFRHQGTNGFTADYRAAGD